MQPPEHLWWLQVVEGLGGDDRRPQQPQHRQAPPAAEMSSVCPHADPRAERTADHRAERPYAVVDAAKAPTTRLRMWSCMTAACSELSGTSKHITANDPTNSAAAARRPGPRADRRRRRGCRSRPGRRTAAIAISRPAPSSRVSGAAATAPSSPPVAPTPNARPIVPGGQAEVPAGEQHQQRHPDHVEEVDGRRARRGCCAGTGAASGSRMPSPARRHSDSVVSSAAPGVDLQPRRPGTPRTGTRTRPRRSRPARSATARARRRPPARP